MKLRVEWVKVSRPPEFKTYIETVFKNSFLDKFNGVENAKKAYDFYKSRPNDLFQDWLWKYHEAHKDIKGLVTPHEYATSGFKVTFE